MIYDCIPEIHKRNKLKNRKHVNYGKKIIQKDKERHQQTEEG